MPKILSSLPPAKQDERQPEDKLWFLQTTLRRHRKHLGSGHSGIDIITKVRGGLEVLGDFLGAGAVRGGVGTEGC